MKCAIMGGGGFIGSHLAEALVADDQDVTILDRPAARYMRFCQDLGAEVIAGDFLNPDDVRRTILGCEVVYHLASATVPQTSNDDPRLDVEANVLGTLQLLEELRRAQVRKIVFASSGGTVYGAPRHIPIAETHPTDPTSSYGICKLTIEKYLHLYWTLHGLDYRVIRAANAYGERQPISPTQGVIAAFLHKLQQNSSITIWGDGSVIRDYIHVGDLAKAFVKAAEYGGEERIFNVGSGRGHSLKDIVSILEEMTAHSLEIEYAPAREFDVRSNVLDISRAGRCLGWQPVIGLQEGILRTYEWMKKERTE